jgi:hypothetical protein
VQYLSLSTCAVPTSQDLCKLKCSTRAKLECNTCAVRAVVKLQCCNIRAVVKCSTGAGLLVSAGWDTRLRLWDPRASQQAAGVASLQLPGKAYSMSLTSIRVVVACSGQQISIYDLRR